jgi:hypothetical protein
MIISETGEIHGRGSHQFRWVSRLTQLEREAVQAGVVVLIRDPLYPGRGTTEFKRVTYWRGKYGHRNYYGEAA